MDFKYRSIDCPQPFLNGHTEHTTHQETFTNAAMDFKQRGIDVRKPMITASRETGKNAEADRDSAVARRLELEAEVRRELYNERQLALNRHSLIDPFMYSYFSSSTLLYRDAFMSRVPGFGFGMHGGVWRNAAEVGEGMVGGSFGSTAMSEGSHERHNLASVVGSQKLGALEGNRSEGEYLNEQLESKFDEKKREAESQAVKNLEEKNETQEQGSIIKETDIVGKRSKKDWSCSICRVETKSEYALKEHCNGKKHKSKEASLKKLKTKENVIQHMPNIKEEHIIMNEATKPTVVVGKKREAEAQAETEVEVNNAPSKVTKKNWNCSLCQVTVTSEKGLEEHFEGKKHKTKEASLNKQKAKEIICHKPPVEQTKENEASSKKRKIEKVVIGDQKKAEDASLSKQVAEDNLCDEPPVDQGSEHHEFWCKLCQVGTSSAESMDIHKNGEKHWKMLLKHRRGVIIYSTKPEDALDDC